MTASPSPKASKSVNTRKRRAQTLEESDFEQESAMEMPASKKRTSSVKGGASATTASTVKKAARMERNRQAAQASRERKKAYTEELEAKVELLEAQLSANTPAQPQSVSNPADLDRIAQLEQENATLREQLATSQSESKQVQDRLGGLESKLEWLTQIMSSQQATSSSRSSVVSVSPSELQQSLPSPPVLNRSLDPQTLLSLMPTSQPFNNQSPASSTATAAALIPSSASTLDMSTSLVAREQREFLPRISTLSKVNRNKMSIKCNHINSQKNSNSTLCSLPPSTQQRQNNSLLWLKNSPTTNNPNSNSRQRPLRASLTITTSVNSVQRRREASLGRQMFRSDPSGKSRKDLVWRLVYKD